MNIQLYSTTDAPNKINKTLTDVQTVAGTLRGEMNLLTPSIEFEFDALPAFNYLYIPDFNRYYFVTGIQVKRTNIYLVSCSIDVLYTYKADILAATATGATGENFNKYAAGNNAVMDARQNETVYKFTDMFNTDGVIVMSGVTSITTDTSDS